MVLTSVVVYSFIELSLPIFTRRILNVYIPGKNTDKIIMSGVWLVILIVLYVIMQFVVAYYGHVLGTGLETTMREKHLRNYKCYHLAIMIAIKQEE